MIAENGLRLMETLLGFGYDGAHREALLQRLPFSSATFYRALKPLLKLGLVEERAPSFFVLPLEHPHNFAFKLWVDQQRILELPIFAKEEIYGLVRRIGYAAGENLLGLWLHGSAAQNTLTSESDFDFVAVLRKEQELSITGPRPVQITVLGERRFRRDFLGGDPFIRTVVAHGLVLFDRNFVQAYYTQELPPLSESLRKEREGVLEDLRDRLLFCIRDKASAEGTQALRSLAVAVSRSMLDVLGKLPAGKDDLVENCQFYFGPAFARVLKECLNPRTKSSRWLKLLDELDHWRDRFATHSDSIRRVVAALQGPEEQLLSAVREMLDALTLTQVRLAEVMPGARDLGYDFAYDDGSGNRVVAEVKSARGPITNATFHSAVKQLKHYGPNSLFIINQYREVSLLERPPLYPKYLAEAERTGVSVLDCVELVRAWIGLVLNEEGALPPALAKTLGVSG